MSGLTPLLITSDKPHARTQPVIWIGAGDHTKQQFKSIDFQWQEAEELLIDINAEGILISGNDRLIPRTNIPGPRKVIENAQASYGNVNAVYEFIERHLGVRWLFPGALGTDLPKIERLVLTKQRRRYAPPFKSRSGLFYYYSLGRHKTGPIPGQIWAKRQRIQLSSMYFDGGHAFVDWWKRYSDQHPEIFALLENGQRKPDQLDPRKIKLCVSNPKVVELWLNQVADELRLNPYKTVFSAAPNDGFTRGHCTCNECRALDVIPLEADVPNTSDRYLHFANKLGEALVARYPNKDYWVMADAYGWMKTPPLEAKPRKNLIVRGVFNTHLRSSKLSQKDSLLFEHWGTLAPLFWRPNLANPAGWRWGAPDVDFREIKEDIQQAHRLKVLGIFFDYVYGHWSTQGPHYYLSAKLAWDPSANPNAILEDYFNRFYGPAAQTMKVYWRKCQHSRRAFLKTYPGKERAFLLPLFYNSQWISEAQNIISEAKKICENCENRYRERIKFTESGLHYFDKVLNLRSHMLLFEKSKAPSLKLKIDSLWNDIQNLKYEMNPAAINFVYAFKRKSNRISEGFHYEAPIKRGRKRRLDRIIETSNIIIDSSAVGLD